MTSSGPAPAGSVTFSADGQVLGTSPAEPGASTSTATLDTGDLAAGSHAITATYGGSAFSDPSQSPALTQAVVPDPTSVVVTSTPVTPLPGQPITYSATVSGIDPVGGVVGGAVAGTVSFTDNGSPLKGCQLMPLPAGSAPHEPAVTCGETDDASTNHVIVAAYSGDAHDAPSQGSLSQTVGQIPTQTSVASSPATTTYGQSVSFTATVAPTASSASPTGTVAFYDDEAALGSAPLSAANGAPSATLTTSGLAAGDHDITAVYSGDAAFSPGAPSTPLRLDIAEAPTRVTLTSSANPVAVGAPATFTASISSPVPGETGHVQFADGGTSIGSGAVVDGRATMQTSFLAPGSHAVTAVYEGDDDFVGTSSINTVDETVGSVPTGLANTVVASPPAPTYGESVTLTATVTAASAAAEPAGTVTFTDGTTTLGSSVLTTTDGATTASMLVTTLPIGASTIGASYSPDPGLPAASPATAPIVVSRAPTTLGIAASDNPYVFGEPVILSATVFPLTGFGEGGTVTFFDNGAVVGTAAVTFGQAALTTTFRQVGTDLITASYSGEPNFVRSSSMSALSETAGSG
jgi:hypothetical protein